MSFWLVSNIDRSSCATTAVEVPLKVKGQANQRHVRTSSVAMRTGEEGFFAARLSAGDSKQRETQQSARVLGNGKTRTCLAWGHGAPQSCHPNVAQMLRLSTCHDSAYTVQNLVNS